MEGRFSGRDQRQGHGNGRRLGGLKARIATALAAASMTVGGPVWSASTIEPLQFRNDGGVSLLTIKADGPIAYTESRVDEDNQYVIELSGVKLGKGATPRLPTSSFPGKVRLVSAYPVEGQEDTVRVVLTLSEPGVEVRTALNGNQLEVSIPIGAATAGSGGASPASDQALDPPPVGSEAAVADASAPSPESGSADTNAAPEDGSSGLLGNFLDARETRRFIGSPITLQVRDMDVVDVLRMIGSASGFNVVADGVNGRITLELVDVPWDQALDVVLTTKQLGAERNNNILRVVPLQSIRAEKEAELAAKAATEANAPKVTRIFPISYADLGQLTSVITPFLSRTTGGSSVSSESQPLVQQDTRTNSLIVRDLPTVIDRVKKLIEILDTQTPQILIEGRIVEASTKFSKSLGGQLASRGNFGPVQAGGATMGVATDALFGDDGTTALSGPPGGFKLGLDMAILGLDRIKALLAIEETEGTTKVISSPRLVVANGKSATITSSLPVAVPQVVLSATGGGGSGLTIQNADLSLNVTPTASNDGFVKLLVQMTKGTPESAGQGQVGVASKSINTEVYVESGSTLSIGGVYSVDRGESQAGIPFLRNIPVLGWLFGSEEKRDNRSELFIFISPRILNEKESVATTDSV